MSNVEGFKKLAREIVTEQEERSNLRRNIKQNRDDLKKDTKSLMGSLANGHKKIAKNLRAGLDENENERKKKAETSKKERQGLTNKRRADIKELRQELNVLHFEMKKGLNLDLKQYIYKLSDGEKNRQQMSEKEIKARKDVTQGLLRDCQSFLKELDEASNIMRNNLMDELSGYRPTLREAEKKRTESALKDSNLRNQGKKALKDDVLKKCQEIREKHNSMGEELRASLKSFDKERRSDAKEFMGSLKRELKATSDAWQELLELTASGKTVQVMETKIEQEMVPEPLEASVAAVETEQETGEALEPEEEVFEPAPSDETVQDEPEVEDVEISLDDLKLKIVDLMDRQDDGLKMTEIATILGLDQWRTLIPVIRELLDEGEIKKEGSLYFI